MALIQVPDPILKLFRRYRLTQQPSGILAEEIVPVVIVDDLSDYQSAGTPKICGGVSRITGVAAQLSFALIGAVAGVRTKVTDCWISVTANTSVDIRTSTQSLVTIVADQKAFLDRRLLGEPQTLIGSNTQVAVPLGQPFWGSNIGGFDMFVHVPLNVVLGNGEFVGNSRIIVLAGAVADDLEVAWRWTEEPIEG